MKFRKGKKFLDSDADGLLDAYERQVGTDPYSADTDKDQLGDYEEVHVYKTNPLDPDTDKDSVSDGAEVKMGRNPAGPGTLKDLFIPHEGNNYRPLALHPKRLAFHAAAVVAIKIVMVGFILTFPIQAWLTPTVLLQQSQKVVDLTNALRSSLELNTLTVSSALQQAAIDKTQDMFVSQYFAHVGPDGNNLRHWLGNRSYNFTVAGENLALGFATPEEVVAAWKNSPTHYANLVDADYQEIGVGMVSGVYQDYDTVLATQYFATPYVAAFVPPEPVEPVAEVIVERPDETVLAEKEAPVVPKIVLGTPTLLSPADRLLSKDNNIDFIISAPQANLVKLTDHGQFLAESQVLDGRAQLNLDLPEGTHQLQIKSFAEDISAESTEYWITIDNTPPLIDYNKTSLRVETVDDEGVTVVQAIAYLSSDIASAKVEFAGYQLNLLPDQTDPNKWSGSKIIQSVEAGNLFDPAVLPSLTVADKAGNSTVQDIAWEKITPVQASAIEQYSFLRDNQSDFIKPLFDFSATYYKFILALAIVALLLNIFIHIKRQHPDMIASALGFIALLTFLTIV